MVPDRIPLQDLPVFLIIIHHPGDLSPIGSNGRFFFMPPLVTVVAKPDAGIFCIFLPPHNGRNSNRDMSFRKYLKFRKANPDPGLA
jgi:hypothetical protein